MGNNVPRALSTVVFSDYQFQIYFEISEAKKTGNCEKLAKSTDNQILWFICAFKCCKKRMWKVTGGGIFYIFFTPTFIFEGFPLQASHIPNPGYVAESIVNLCVPPIFSVAITF